MTAQKTDQSSARPAVVTNTKRRSITKRGNERAEALIQAALNEFAAKGFHGTNINEIGAAAGGVSGPAIYRHFDSKMDILAEIVQAAVQKVGRSLLAVRRKALPPEEALAELCGEFASVCVDNPDLMAVFALEVRHLDASQAFEHNRNKRLYREELSHLLMTCRPELTEVDARAMVKGAIYIALGACLEDDGMDKNRQKQLLKRMMVGALNS